MTRKSQLAAGQPPKYTGTCYHLSDEERKAKEEAGIKPTLRFHIEPKGEVSFQDLIKGPQQFLCDDLGDFIIARSDGTAGRENVKAGRVGVRQNGIPI